MNIAFATIRAYFDQTHIPQRYVLAAYLFGFLARDQAHTSSDVDIAVLLEPGLDAVSSLKLQMQFEVV